MSKPPIDSQAAGKDSHKSDTRTDIATADDVNVDEDNAIGSPKNSLTAVEQQHPEDTNSTKNPGDEVTRGTEQTGKVPCENCNGTGKLDGGACPQCAGTGEVIVNVGDA